MKGRDEALRLLAEADPLYGEAEVRAAVERMAVDITARLGNEFPVVLSVMGGAAIFTGQLLPLLHFPLEFGAIEVTRYNNDIQGREIQLTDAIGRLLREESVMAYEFQGQRYDCGSKLGYLQATVNFALKHPELATDFRAFLATIPAAGKKP